MWIPKSAAVTLVLLAAGVVGVSGQTKLGRITTPVAPAPTPAPSSRSTPAAAELLLRRAEATSELEALLLDYTESYPKVKRLRFETAAIQKELDRLAAVPPADFGRLSDALGRLMVRKSELAADLEMLLGERADGHPDVKRARRRVEIYEQAIAEILGGK